MTKLGGLIDLSSEATIGTTLTLTLPVTLAIVGVLTFRVCGTIYCVSLAAMEEALMFERGSVRLVDGREVVTHRGTSLPIVRLGSVFQEPEAETVASTKQYLVIVRMGAQRLGLIVDALLEQRDVVVKALGRSFDSVRGFAGAADLGENALALILDAPTLIHDWHARGEPRALLEERTGELS
jgi:two-component system, chemotaxis family, sensor kinase CheA